MGFSEFYANASTGSNMSGGSDENTSPSYTATNGGWNSGTGVFTPTSGDPSASVTVGQFAHVFADGSTTPTFIGRVTAVDSTTVTVSTTAKSGTAPGTAGTGISINVGGVWKGPNGAVAFPFGFITSAQTNASGDKPRVNFKNNAQYDITANMTHSVNGPCLFQGYTSTAGDGGKATIDGGTSGSSYILLTHNATQVDLVDFIFKNNGATGSSEGIRLTGYRSSLTRVVVAAVRGHGWNIFTGNGNILTECETYTCNQSNTAGHAGYTIGSSASLVRCIAHDNSGANNVGFLVSTNTTADLTACIADTNGSHGYSVTATAAVKMSGCEAYNNSGSGLNLAGGAGGVVVQIESSNFIKNGAYGITGDTKPKCGRIVNCGFGAGTQANSSGTINTANMSGIDISGTVTYASDVTPWVDPANGDFRISLAAAKGAGRGAFTQTASSYAGAVGYPDIGAAQHQDAGGGGLIRPTPMSGGLV